MDVGRLYVNIVRKLPPPRPKDELEVHRQLYRPIRQQLCQLGDQLYDQLYDQLGDQLYDQLGRQLRGHDGEGPL